MTPEALDAPPAPGHLQRRFGLLMAFLFIWQFILSGPLEIASGCIGFSQYLTCIKSVWRAASSRENNTQISH